MCEGEKQEVRKGDREEGEKETDSSFVNLQLRVYHSISTPEITSWACCTTIFNRKTDDQTPWGTLMHNPSLEGIMIHFRDQFDCRETVQGEMVIKSLTIRSRVNKLSTHQDVQNL